MASHTTYRRKVRLSNQQGTTEVVVEVSSPIPRGSRWYCIVHFPTMMGSPIKVGAVLFVFSFPSESERRGYHD